MILSDRVSGRMPVWGLMAAAALAIVSLPGLSLAQKSAGTSVPSSEQIAESARQSPASTAARLEQIESELKRVQPLARRGQTIGHRPVRDGDRSRSPRPNYPTRRIRLPRWNSLKVIDKHSTVITFSGASQNTF